jgi:hypothetical protein
VDESDEKVLGGVLGGREVNGRGRLPRRLENVSCFSQTRPACSRRPGLRLREFPFRLGRQSGKIPAAKLIDYDDFDHIFSLQPATRATLLRAK